jgi:UDP-2,3-diacylglucosamine pyrophosphatase LpxH
MTTIFYGVAGEGLGHASRTLAVVDSIPDFEECLIKYSKEKGCDGCVCGHIHTPDYKVLPNGFIYANSGDWVESCTAFYEDFSGEFHIYRHPLV